MAEEDRLKAHNSFNQRLIALADLRTKKFDEAQKIIDQQREEVKQEQLAIVNRAKGRAAAEKKNWHHEAGQGALMGMTVAGPFGAIAGAIIGGIGGMAEAISTRMDEGDSGAQAFFSTVGDTGLGINLGEGFGKGDFTSEANIALPGVTNYGEHGGFEFDQGEAMQAAQVAGTAYATQQKNKPDEGDYGGMSSDYSTFQQEVAEKDRQRMAGVVPVGRADRGRIAGGGAAGEGDPTNPRGGLAQANPGGPGTSRKGPAY